MPDLTGFPALDVAIGLAFLFFLLSTICSAINEGIAAVFAWRAKNLEDAIARLLGEAVQKDKKALTGNRLTDQVLRHWRISALTKDPSSDKPRNNRPSYIPARAFSRALSEVVAGLPVPAVDETGQPTETKPVVDKPPWELADDELMAAVTEVLGNLPAGQGRDFLQKAAKIAGDDLERFRTEVENAFDDTMVRASGWYKRHVQVALTVIAIGVTLTLNVDSVRVADRLWKSPELRASVAATATQAASAGKQSPETVGKSVNKVNELNLPIGWGGANAPATGHEFLGIVRRIPGWIFTILALSLGAPFWFDLLSRLARLRNSGPPAEPHSQSDQPPGSGSTGAADHRGTAAATGPSPAGGRVTTV
jgi:hypothetical protein